MDKYEFKQELGSGQFGVVSLYNVKQSHEKVAIKAVTIPNKFDGFPSSILREVSILKELEHPNIVRLLDVCTDDKTLYLVFEFLDCELSSLIEKGLTPSEIKMIMHGLLSGLDYLHSSMIIHRDFCPTNVLVKKNIKDSTYTVKIADFGLSRYTVANHESYTHTECTYEYTAPEQLLHAPTYSAPVDIWAAGCMFAEMVNRQHLFMNNRELCSIAHISKILGVPTNDTWPELSSFAPAFCCLSHEKPTGLRKAVKNLDSDGFDLLKEMLVWNPSLRINAHKALQHPYFKELASLKAI